MFGVNCSETCNCTSVNSYCDPIGGCSCSIGWKNPNCSSPCDPGSYGNACSKSCTCLNGATCDPINGSCSCTPGWVGSDCNMACSPGYFGIDCQGNCTCMNGATCDHVTGHCTCLTDWGGPNCTKSTRGIVRQAELDSTTSGSEGKNYACLPARLPACKRPPARPQTPTSN